MAKPLEIVHDLPANELRIAWDDGITSTYPIPYLRAWCPCAGCQGHGGIVRRRAVDETVAAQGLFEIGAYAICIRYADGHDTGIFTWDWLLRLRPEHAPVGYKHGSFTAGEFV